MYICMRIGPKVHVTTFIGSSLYDTRPIFKLLILTQNETLQFSKFKNQSENKIKDYIYIHKAQQLIFK